MKTTLVIAALSAVFIFQTAPSIRVELAQRTSIDDEGISVTPFYREPKEALIFPKVNRAHAQFFDVFYSWDIDDDNTISVMVLKNNERDELYIDANNDEDLTNDGSPYVFPHLQNDFVLQMVSRKDPKQAVKILLQRKPVSSDSLTNKRSEDWLFDNEGNLQKQLVMVFGQRTPGFDGKKGTFYFDSRITLSRGEAQIADKTFQVGLFDYNNNGLFNDIDGRHGGDLILIDLNGDGKLSMEVDGEVFKLNEVIRIENQNYKPMKIDPYGRRFELINTNEPQSFAYLKEIQQYRLQREEPETQIDATFWELSLDELKGRQLHIKNLKGKYLLLNFWGEWCKPCVAEIPEIVEAYKNIPREKFEVISFLKTDDLEAARRMIAEKIMEWHHVLLTAEIAAKFKIKEYPTNILVSPDGNVIRRTFQLNRTFLYQFVQ